MVRSERLEGSRAEGFVAGCAALAREPVVSSVYFEAAMQGLDAAYSERPLLAAPTLALDLTPLLAGERLLPTAPPTSELLRRAVRGYEDHLLARLTGDRRWTRLTDAMAAAPKGLRPAAVGMVVTQVLRRLSVEGGTGVSQAIVRRLSQRAPEEVVELGRTALGDEELVARVADGLTTVARAARKARELLTDAEVFVVENISALKGLAPRVALAQLAEVAQAIEEQLPTRLRGHLFDDGQAPTQLEVDSAYPVGGFASLSTSGSVENLVTSELIYIDGPGALRPDLFDLRFVEGELLYYSRDESVALRRRRRLVMVFDPSLLQMRVKDRGERYQRVVWALGSLAALVRKLTSWLDTEALTFEVVFARAGGESPLTEEMAVLELLLREFRERGQLEIHESETSAAAIAAARAAHGPLGRVLLFATQLPPELEAGLQPDAFVNAGGARPQVSWNGGLADAGKVSTAAEAWAQLTGQLLHGLLRPGRV